MENLEESVWRKILGFIFCFKTLYNISQISKCFSILSNKEIARKSVITFNESTDDKNYETTLYGIKRKKWDIISGKKVEYYRTYTFESIPYHKNPVIFRNHTYQSYGSKCDIYTYTFRFDTTFHLLNYLGGLCEYTMNTGYDFDKLFDINAESSEKNRITFCESCCIYDNSIRKFNILEYTNKMRRKKIYQKILTFTRNIFNKYDDYYFKLNMKELELQDKHSSPMITFEVSDNKSCFKCE